jgi:hypothetical protein
MFLEPYHLVFLPTEILDKNALSKTPIFLIFSKKNGPHNVRQRFLNYKYSATSPNGQWGPWRIGGRWE